MHSACNSLQYYPWFRGLEFRVWFAFSGGVCVLFFGRGGVEEAGVAECRV